MDDWVFAPLAPYVIARTAKRRVGFRLLSDGTLRISAPPRLSDHKILELAMTHLDWVNKARADQKKRISAYDFDMDNQIFYHGKIHHITSDSTLLLGIRIDSENGQCYYGGNPANPKQYVLRLLRLSSEQELTARVHLLAVKTLLHERVKSVRIKDLKTQWGNCSSQRRITLNWRLLMAPIAVIDYVIYHELAHLLEFNHSERFWMHVATFDPHFNQHRKWLTQHHDFLSAPPPTTS